MQRTCINEDSLFAAIPYQIFLNIAFWSVLINKRMVKLSVVCLFSQTFFTQMAFHYK